MNNNNKNGFLITWISCIVILLTLCFFGISDSIKGTRAAQCLEYSCQQGYLVGDKCKIDDVEEICIPGETYTKKCSGKGCCPAGWSSDCEYNLEEGVTQCYCSYTSSKKCYDNTTTTTVDATCSKWSGTGNCPTPPTCGTGYKQDYDSQGCTICVKDNNTENLPNGCFKVEPTGHDCMWDNDLKCYSSCRPVVDDEKKDCLSKEPNGYQCMYDNDLGCWTSCIKLGDGNDACPEGIDIDQNTPGCQNATGKNYSCETSYGDVENGYWSGSCTSTSSGSNSTYSCSCNLNCYSGYAKQNGMCIKCDDCTGGDKGTEACYLCGSIYSFGFSSDHSGCFLTSVSDKNSCKGSAVPPGYEPNPTPTPGPGTGPSGPTPSGESSGSSTPSTSGCYKNKDTGVAKWFESDPDSKSGTDLYEKVANSECGHNITDNPATGQIAMFIIWIIGFISIGYSIYYLMKFSKSE